MTRRGLLVLSLSLLLLAGAAVAGFLLLPRSPITQANVDRIRPGMSLAEVETILGPPAGHLPGDWHPAELAGVALLDPAQIVDSPWWNDGGRTATVFMGDDGRVLGATFIDHRPAGILTELRRLLGL